jgi:membrane-associated phospholipid phosphatase
MSAPAKKDRTVSEGTTSLRLLVDDSPAAKLGRSNAPLWVVAGLALLGFAALAIDVPLAEWLAAQKLPGFLKKICDLAEVFGHGLGVAAILFTAWVLLPQQRSQLPRVICCAYLAGLLADCFKLFLSRSRPNTIDLAALSSVWATFHRWFPLLSAGSGEQSFISAHTATGVGLALGLGWLLPRGKWLFGFFALLVALQRMTGLYHFASDTLWGAAIGWLTACALLPGGWLAPQFDRLERKFTAA